MRKQPLVSIIMPVYNAEEYVEDAINSILNQSYKNIELILIDDGSIDLSGKICDKIGYMDNRVKVIHQENKGIAGARNSGLVYSTGEYIAFCDNDDLFLPGLLEDNMEVLLKYKADAIKFGKRIVVLDGNKQIDTEDDNFINKVLEYDEIKKDFPMLDTERYFGFIWDAIFSRNLLINSNGNNGILLFDESFKTGYEDVDYNYRIVSHIKKLVVNSNIYYAHYIRNGYSTTLRYSYNRIESIYKIVNEKSDLLEHFGYTVEDISTNEWIISDLGEKTASVISLLSLKSSNMKYRQKREELIKFNKIRLYSISYKKRAKLCSMHKSLSRFVLFDLIHYKMYLIIIILGYVRKRLISKLFYTKSAVIK